MSSNRIGPAVAAAAAFGLAISFVPNRIANGAAVLGVLGTLVGLLAVLVVRSVRTTVVVGGLAASGAVVIFALGRVDAPTAPLRLVAWIVVATASITLAYNAGRLTLRALAPALLTGAAALLAGPGAAGLARPSGDLGNALGLSSGQASLLSPTARLDMTRRPELSDRVVMTVEADAPAFWRSQVFEMWDGSSWMIGPDGVSDVGPGGAVAPEPGAEIAGRRRLTQHITVTGVQANVLPAAATAIDIDAPGGVSQTPDGTLLSHGVLGDGGSYTVVSAVPDVTLSQLQAIRPADAADPTEAAILARYAATPTATPRVQALAVELGEHAATPGEFIVGAEQLLARTTDYSLDAPLSPAGVDVVDHFLFESREGWCEQIASSLVVLARLHGIPARLATGYAIGSYDSVGRRYLVRERDAHAWAEVWFPDAGWVPFDPTAVVPLADSNRSSFTSDIATAAGIALLVAAVIVLGAGPAVRIVRRLIARLRSRRGRPSERMLIDDAWVRDAERRLDAAGRERGVARESSETATAFARRLADDELARVGVAIDRIRYGGPDAERRDPPDAGPARE